MKSRSVAISELIIVIVVSPREELIQCIALHCIALHCIALHYTRFVESWHDVRCAMDYPGKIYC
jgi:hypothetical protein